MDLSGPLSITSRKSTQIHENITMDSVISQSIIKCVKQLFRPYLFLNISGYHVYYRNKMFSHVSTGLLVKHMKHLKKKTILLVIKYFITTGYINSR